MGALLLAANRRAWAALLQRIFGLDALRCPRCGSTLRIIGAIEDPTVARRILECMGLPARAPPLSPAPADTHPWMADEAQEEATWEFDQTPGGDEP